MRHQVTIFSTALSLCLLVAEQARATVQYPDWECAFSETGLSPTAWRIDSTGKTCLSGKGAGYVYYRTRLGELGAGEIGIGLGSIGEADELSVNGQVVGKTGSFPPAYQNAMHRPRLYYLGSGDKLSGGELVLKVYSEFPVNRGLNVGKVEIAPYAVTAKAFYKEDFLLTTGLPLILTLFLFTSIFTAYTWIQRRSDCFHLWMAATSLFMASYTFFLSRYGYELSISNETNYRGLVGSAILITATLGGLAASVARTRLSPVLWSSVALNVICAGLLVRLEGVAELRSAYKAWFIAFVAILVVLIGHFSIARQNARVRYLLPGSVLFFMAALNDISITLGLRTGANLAHYGLAIFAVVFILTEASSLISELKRKTLQEAERAADLKTKEEINRVIIERNEQVAHDIFSPLTALDVALVTTGGLPEESRNLMRLAVSRIRDIANNLAKKETDLITTAVPSNDAAIHETSIQLLPALADEIVSEKRMQYRERVGVEIRVCLRPESYGLFADVSPREFKRALSNLINNAVEAISGSGVVEVSVRRSGASAKVIVRDTGRGIPRALVDKLGARGFTSGKETGSGLGLAHAKACVEAWNGQIEIDSTEETGTTVALSIPFSQQPNWFCDRLLARSGQQVVILDDDLSIHRFWDARLMEFAPSMRIHHLHGAAQFREWIEKNHTDAGSALFLIDYELAGTRISGLDLIEEAGIQSRSTLVTSRAEDSKVRTRAEGLGVKILPKGLASLIPLQIADGRPDAILVDDEDWVHAAWQMAAKSQSKELRSYKSADEMRAALANLDRDIPIYVDVNLNSSVRGDQFAEELRLAGFTFIYLATGYKPERFSGLEFIRGVCSKSPPWVAV